MGIRHGCVCAILNAVAIGGSLSLAKAQGTQSQPTGPPGGSANHASRAKLDTTPRRHNLRQIRHGPRLRRRAECLTIRAV